jgi:hypothetical protein
MDNRRGTPLKHVVPVIFLAFLLVHCDSPTQSFTDDYTGIADARERWRAWDLSSYAIVKTRSCECLAPYTYTIVVKDGELIDVFYERPKEDEKLGQTLFEKHEYLLASVRTVEDLFDLLEHYETRAAHFEVVYHPKYGYPTEIFIDPVRQIADDEIIRTLSDLTRLID